MKVLVIGSGGREHAIAYSLVKSPKVTELHAFPGNPGIAKIGKCIKGSVEDLNSILELSKQENYDLIVIGPEVPLCMGLADLLVDNGFKVFGPKKQAAELEGSKAFSKRFMTKYNIPTAKYIEVDSFDEAVESLSKFDYPVVVKADGLAETLVSEGEWAIATPSQVTVSEVKAYTSENAPYGAYLQATGKLTKDSSGYYYLTDGTADINQSTNENGKVVNPTYGACLKGYEFTLTPGWISVPSEVNFNANDNVVPVPLLLGADYMMSVEFWNKIHGLEGLLSWGQDETLLSLKTWLAGSKVYLIQDMIFGHVYRNKRPYNAIAIEMNSNYIYCNYLFAKDDKDYEELNWLYEKYLGHDWYMKAYDCFMERFEEAKAFKEYFYNEVATQTMEWFWEFNYNADPKQVQEFYDNKNQKLAERNTETNS